MKAAIVVVVVAIIALCGARAAHAQAFSFERFAPPIDGESVLDVEAGSLVPPLVVDVALWGSAAINPLVDVVGEPVVVERLGVHAVAAVGLLEWLELGLELPLVLRQSAADGALDSVFEPAGLAATGFGDMRFVPKFSLLRAHDVRGSAGGVGAGGVDIDVAVLTAVTLPTGFPGGAFLSERAFTFAPQLAASSTWGPVRAAANVGARLREERAALDVRLGQEVLYAAGAVLRFHDVVHVPAALGVSVHGAVAATRPFADARENPLEALLGVTLEAPAGLQWFAGVGGGAFGIGVPERRVLLGLRYAPRAVQAPAPVAAPVAVNDDSDDDSDDDTVDDQFDRCPYLRETDNGVRDDDGCPEDPRSLADPGVASGTQGTAGASRHSEPRLASDSDADGLADDVDLCPALREDSDGFEDGDGCPEADNDGDGNDDDRDACPLAAETMNDFDDDDGCPDAPPAALLGLVGAVAGIAFQTGSADLTREAVVVLQGVRAALVQHPALTLHIEGHASSDGDAAANLALSARRAHAVRDWLVARGIDAARLEDAGLGDARRIDLADSPAAHARNRRVVLTYKTRVAPR